MKVLKITAMALSTLALATSQAQTSTPSSGSAPTVWQACKEDAARLCGDAKDPQSRTQCMNQHRNELSDGCIAARKAVRPANQVAPQGANSGDSGASTPSVRAAIPEAHAPAPDAGVNSITARITGREFPSVFEAWSPAENFRKADGSTVPLQTIESRLATEARHDLYWGGGQQLGLKLADGQQYPLLAPVFAPESIQAAVRDRATMLAANPSTVILSEVHFRTAPSVYLPPDSPYWIRDGDNYKGNGKRYGNHQLDPANPELQDKVAAFCAALVRTGAYDDCMFDVWLDDATAQDSLFLIRKVRSAVGEKRLISQHGIDDRNEIELIGSWVVLI